MPDFDLLIHGGMIVDGTGAPRHRSDLGIKDGKVADVGRFQKHQGKEVLDAGRPDRRAGLRRPPHALRRPGLLGSVLLDLGLARRHVGRDRQLRLRLRAGASRRRASARCVAMPASRRFRYESMKAGMPWDWVTFPEFLDSLDRTPKGVNMLPYVPIAPLLVWVMGLERGEGRRACRPTTSTREMRRLLHEAMDAGGCGWSAQRLGPNGPSVQTRLRRPPMVTDVMHDETAIAFAGCSRERNEGFIQMTYLAGLDERSTTDGHFEEIAEVSGRPIIYERGPGERPLAGARTARCSSWLDTLPRAGHARLRPGRHDRRRLHFHARGLEPLRRQPPRGCEATPGTDEERSEDGGPRAPAARSARSASGIVDGVRPTSSSSRRQAGERRYENMTLGEIGRMQGKHPVDAMLDLAVAEDLETEFYAPSVGRKLEHLKEILSNDMTLLGVSDGGAHTKFFTAGRYPTESIVRSRARTTCSRSRTFTGACRRGPRGAPASATAARSARRAGGRRRLRLREPRSAADGGRPRPSRRRVAPRAAREGYRWVLVNGEVTIENDKPTGATPGKLLRHGK